jgi:hypothetical protein
VVYEQVLTILFAVCVGAALVVYAAKPRHRSVSVSMAQGSAIESFGQAIATQPAYVPQTAATETPTTESPVSSDSQIVEVTPTPILVVPSIPGDAISSLPTSTIETTPISSAQTADVASTTATAPTRTRRAPRKKSTTGTTRARSSTRAKKAVDTVEK